MIRVLEKMFRRRRPSALTAPLSDLLVLHVDGADSRNAGVLRASTQLAGLKISVSELGEGGTGDSAADVGLEELLDQVVPQLDQVARSELLDFVLGTALPDLSKPGAVTLAQNLCLLRDRLQRALPELRGDSPGGPILTVDTIVAIDNRSFWFAGWARNEDGALARLEAVSPEGQRAKLLEGAYRFARPDVEESLAAVGVRSAEKHGFAKYVDLPAPSPLHEGWLCEVRSPSGSGFQVGAPRVTRDPVAACRMITELAPDQLDVGVMRRDQGYPALQRLQGSLAQSTEVENEIQYGAPPASPDLSIVVPLYRRIDFVEHQIVQFWEDPEVCASEVIYVLDSPELAEPLTRLAAGLHELYGIPLKVVVLNRNAGYATANNLAASVARGRLLLLLNSDVLPAAPGWAGRMRNFYDATPDIGALGPRLLYEDDSIQHAGMYFQRDPVTGYWENQHYFKGLSPSIPAANVSRPVPAVTGACLMVDRDLWEEIGGLQDAYVQGGYEDSDFCLRVLAAGRQNWYLANVELYHLEAQSFRIAARGANRYNAWLQTHLWDEYIEGVMRAQPEITARVPAFD